MNGIENITKYINDSKKPVLQKDGLLPKLKKIFSKNDKRMSKFLSNNLDLMLDSITDYSEFMDVFFENEEFEKSPENIIKIFDKVKQEYLKIYSENEEFLKQNEEITSYLRNNLKNYLSKCENVLNYIAVKYLDKLKDTEFEKERINQLFEMTSGDNFRIPLIFSIIEKVKGKYPELDEKMNEILKDNKTAFSEYLIGKKIGIQAFCNIPEDKEKYNVFLTMIIDELLEEQKKDYIDIEEIGSGLTSDVYKIGDKILKIGNGRITKEIPYSRRLLQPLYRSKMDKDDYLFVEISERVQEIDINEEAYEEEVYKIFKELMDEGIVWMDPAPRNIGILLKDNEAFLDGKAIEVDSNATNIKTEGKKEVLKKGDFVILDTDFLYSLDELDKHNIGKNKWTSTAQYYMERYEIDKKKEERKKNEGVETEKYDGKGIIEDCMQDMESKLSSEQNATHIVIRENEEKNKGENPNIGEGEAYGE